jgi:flagellar basal-body rod protein FlgB
MKANLVFDSIIAKTGLPTLKRTLDLASLRQKVTAGNIANAQTPGYKPREVDFAGELKKLVTEDRLKGVRTDPAHIPVGEAKRGRFLVTRSKSATEGTPLNVEAEMAALAETQIWYQMGTTLARRKFEALRLAIKGER